MRTGSRILGAMLVATALLVTLGGCGAVVEAVYDGEWVVVRVTDEREETLGCVVVAGGIVEGVHECTGSGPVWWTLADESVSNSTASYAGLHARWSFTFDRTADDISFRTTMALELDPQPDGTLAGTATDDFFTVTHYDVILRRP